MFCSETLTEWDPKWFRLFVSDVSNDCTEKVLTEAFSKYKTFQKAKVIKDRLSNKVRSLSILVTLACFARARTYLCLLPPRLPSLPLFLSFALTALFPLCFALIQSKYAFLAFSDPEDFLLAWKQMDGKYVGNRPIRLSKATTQVRSVEIGNRKAKMFDKAAGKGGVGVGARGRVL